MTLASLQEAARACPRWARAAPAEPPSLPPGPGHCRLSPLWRSAFPLPSLGVGDRVNGREEGDRELRGAERAAEPVVSCCCPLRSPQDRPGGLARQLLGRARQGSAPRCGCGHGCGSGRGGSHEDRPLWCCGFLVL